MALSIVAPDLQVRALTRVAMAFAQAGQHHRAEAVVRQAEAATRSIADPDERARALAQVAGALIKAGLHRQAVALARSIASLEPRGRPEAQVAGRLAEVAVALGGRDRTSRQRW